MKHVLIQNGSSTGLKAYLESAAGLGLWSYHQSLGIWISKRELTPQELSAAIAVGGSHTIIPVSKIKNGLS